MHAVVVTMSSDTSLALLEYGSGESTVFTWLEFWPLEMGRFSGSTRSIVLGLSWIVF